MNKIPWDPDLSYINIDSIRMGRREGFRILAWATHEDISNRDKENWKVTGLKVQRIRSQWNILSLSYLGDIRLEILKKCS